MKKVLLVLFIVFSLGMSVNLLACPDDEETHEEVQAMLEDKNIPVTLKGKKIIVENKKLYSLALKESNLDKEAAEEAVETIIFTLCVYADNHGLEVEEI
ncbi:hypothetical protein [Fusobacterium sp.]|uniref:hypothetical protein n=1 Tax=Fusobacterium sp. TaxID=68766 RepID=UPI0028FFA999|nr:hypothetical protein [Fusobacterium sp.]MDU1911044.1 hypothetical protein [Fusobacterium sp.]